MSLMNGAAAIPTRDDAEAAKVDGMAAAIDHALNGKKLVGQPRDGFILMIVPANRGKAPAVSHYASSVTPLAVAYVLRDQLQKIEAAMPQAELETTEDERSEWIKRADDAGRLARDFNRLVADRKIARTS